MTLRASEIAAVCAEIDAHLSGQPVQKAVQPDDDTLLLGFPRGWLFLEASARAGRLHLTSKPAGTGESPPAFCMLVRKHCLGARVAACRAVEGERACELELVNGQERLALRLFLFGPAAQLQLVDAGDGDRVLGAIGPARRLYDALPAPHPHGAAAQTQRYATSAQIEEAYAHALHDDAVRAARAGAQRRLSAELKKATRLVVHLDDDLARVAEADARRKEADLLLAHLHEVPKGASEVTLPDDFTDGSLITIALNPARSARDNAERLYKEQRRLHKARAAIEQRLLEAKAKVAALELELAALQERTDAQVLADARAPQPIAPQRRHHEARALPYKQFTSVRGVPIFVGRGAEKNDTLTFKVARGNDLWLHTRDVPGAHVIVPLDGRDVDAETLIDAATLAAHHSSLRDEAQVDIGYALRKHVRKAKGAPPGAVLVSQQKTVRVRMEAERLKRLLASGRT